MILGAQAVPWTLSFPTFFPVLGVTMIGHEAHNLPPPFPASGPCSPLLRSKVVGLCRATHSDVLSWMYLTRALRCGPKATPPTFRSGNWRRTISEAQAAAPEATSQLFPKGPSLGCPVDWVWGRGRAAIGGALAAGPPTESASTGEAGKHVLAFKVFHQMSWEEAVARMWVPGYWVPSSVWLYDQGRERPCLGVPGLTHPPDKPMFVPLLALLQPHDFLCVYTANPNTGPISLDRPGCTRVPALRRHS